GGKGGGAAGGAGRARGAVPGTRSSSKPSEPWGMKRRYDLTSHFFNLASGLSGNLPTRALELRAHVGWLTRGRMAFSDRLLPGRPGARRSHWLLAGARSSRVPSAHGAAGLSARSEVDATAKRSAISWMTTAGLSRATRAGSKLSRQSVGPDEKTMREQLSDRSGCRLKPKESWNITTRSREASGRSAADSRR